MPIVSSEIKKVVNKHNGNRAIYEQHIDHIGNAHAHRYQTDAVFDIDAALITNAVWVESTLPTKEIADDAGVYKTGGAEHTPDHQLQADYDRVMLRELMMEEDAQAFGNTLPFFRAFEVRAGSNANARANYLGVPKSEYDLVALRYNQITGLISGMDADRGRVWELASFEGWL